MRRLPSPATVLRVLVTILPLGADLWVTDGEVHALARSGDTLYVGGLFKNAGPYTGGGLRFTAGVNAPLAGPSVRGSVHAVIADGAGGWFIAGSFDSVGGQFRKNLARLNPDGSLHPWTASTSDRVNSLALANGVLYAGGQFTQANSIARLRLAWSWALNRPRVG
jgi:hypothetical protein